jgi:predicted solute-binding protein
MPHNRLKVCAVSYLNTVPLIWGMLHGRQQGLFDLLYRLPAECADLLAAGEVDVGILPCFELLRQDLGTVPGVGIACRGPVRSILLVSKVPLGEIRTLAGDSSSRTSVNLARIVLERRYGTAPRVIRLAPDLTAMLDSADAALVIGDPALRIDPAGLPYDVRDLGAEWMEMTGLPMVFAVWAGRREGLDEEAVRAFQDSCACGLAHIEEIVRAEAGPRGFTPELVRHYLTRNLVCELGAEEYRGMELFLRYARELAERGAGAGGSGV